MAVKLTTTKITGIDEPGYEDIGINANLRITQGYADDAITIKIEKIIRPENTRDEEVDITYETLIERTLTTNDFPMITDHKAWYAEYDVVKNEVSILDVLVFGEQNRYKESNYHGGNLHRDIKKRYNSNFLPLLYVKSFDAAATGFSASLINFYRQDNPGTASDTIITNQDAEEMTTQQRQAWINANLVSYFTFTIKNEDGSQVINAPQTRLFTVDGQNSNARSNKYKVNLPPAKYTIEVNVEKELYPENKNTYDIRVLNGYINKTRVIAGAGTFNVKLDLSELETSDFSKLKFDLGQFSSYAELWIDIE
jgi:hypothetical protein